MKSKNYLSTRFFSIDYLYDKLNIFIAYVLLLTSFLLTVYSVYDFVIELINGIEVISSVLHLIHHLLLIMIILEILWTLNNYIKTHKISLEAFLAIGIISSIRKILVISMDISTMEKPASASFMNHPATDLLFQGVMIFLLTVSIYIIRKSQKDFSLEE